MGVVLVSVYEREGGRGLIFWRVNGRGETCQRWYFVRGVLCHEERRISKSVDTWLTRQGQFWGKFDAKEKSAACFSTSCGFHSVAHSGIEPLF